MQIIDTCGLKCPLPILKLEKHLSKISGNFTLKLITDDEMAIIDIPLFCQQNNYAYQLDKQQGTFSFLISKNSDKTKKQS